MTDVKHAVSAPMQGAVNVLSPLKALTWAFAIFFIGLLLSPIRPDITYSFASVCFLLICIAAAFCGAYLASPRPIDSMRGGLGIAGEFDWAAGSRRCISISTVGVALLMIDRFFIRGVSVADDVFEARSAIEDAGSGPIGLIAAFLSSFAAFGCISTWLAKAMGQQLPKTWRVLAAINLGTYIWLSVSLGSRSLFLVCTILHMLAFVFFRRSEGKSFSRWVILNSVLVAVGIVAALATVLVDRLDVMGLSAIDSIQLSAYAYTLKPTDSVLSFLEKNEFLETFGAAIYSLILYFYHGFYEFLLMFDSYRGEFTLGAQTFWLPQKIMEVVFRIDPAPDLELFQGYRSGVFTTFFGPIYVDFGLFSPLFVGALFYFITLPLRRVAAGDLRWLFVCLQVVTIVCFAPMTNLLTSATGTYLLVSGFAIFLMTPKLQYPAPRARA